MAIVSYDTLKALRKVATQYRIDTERLKKDAAKPQKKRRWWNFRKQ